VSDPLAAILDKQPLITVREAESIYWEYQTVSMAKMMKLIRHLAKGDKE
jgi:hypothetical protein